MEAQLLPGLTRPVGASQAGASLDTAVSSKEVLQVPDSLLTTCSLPKLGLLAQP